MWVQSHVALPFVINLLKLSFRDDFSSNFNLLNFVSWFSDSRVFEKIFFFEFCFCCCYSVPVVFNLLFCFLFVKFSFSFQWQLLNDSTIFLEFSESNECLCFFLKLNCLRFSIVERSVTLMKYFFRDTF